MLDTTIVAFLLQFIAGLMTEAVLKEGLRKAREAAKQLKMPSVSISPTLFSRTKLVNRERELRAIQAALRDAPHLRILYFSGSGGVGKTRLLQEAEQLLNKESGHLFLRWSGVLDLYHADLHSVLALQAALVQRLDPFERYFQRYREARKQFERRRGEGLTGQRLNAERAELDLLFFEDYEAFSRTHRSVIVLDTLESVCYESDLIQELCRLGNVSVAAWEWLLEWTSRLNNSVFLLASRPQPMLKQELERVHGSKAGQIELIEVSGLTRDDSRQLLSSLLKGTSRQLQALHEQSDNLWQLSQGRPVQLALILQLAAESEQIVSLLSTLAADDVTAWGRHLVDALFNIKNMSAEPTHRIFFLLALARKGLTADLLHFLQPDWSTEECEQNLEQIREHSLVKTHPGRDDLFLHDALYELFDSYSPPRPQLLPWFKSLADYYRLQQAQAEGRTRHHVTVNLLYYDLRYNPRQAFENGYLRWNETAIKGHEAGFDMQLRDELLRFLHSSFNQQLPLAERMTKQIVDQDSAVRWAKRFLMQQKWHQAIAVAETILALGPEPYSTLTSNRSTRLADLSPEQQAEAQELFNKADALFWGDLLTVYGEAMTYTGSSETLVGHVFKLAIELLSSTSQSPLQPLAWLRNRILGWAHNTLGYLQRTKGHYGRAQASYSHALEDFQAAAMREERAITLNNLAFLLALLGNQEPARQAAEQALELRRQIGQRYPLALSYNTRGLIYALQGEVELARRDCLWARDIFEELQEARGIGLACNALGFILRQQAKGSTTGQQSLTQATELFQQAVEFLERAVEIFSEQVPEPIRLWEAHNELGSLFREWGRMLQQEGDQNAAEMKYEQAIEHLSQAVNIALAQAFRFQTADTYDDIAQVWADQGDLTTAHEWLEKTLNLVPPEYKQPIEQGFQDAPEPGEAYWLILGKAHWQQGLWALRALQQKPQHDSQRPALMRTALEHLALATLYFERYWPATALLQTRLATITDQLARADIATEEAREIVNDLASQYKTPLNLLLKAIGEPVTG